jgi:hypothetical protein
MTDETGPIRQISGNFEKFQAGKGELSHSTPKGGYLLRILGGLEGPEHLRRRA